MRQSCVIGSLTLSAGLVENLSLFSPCSSKRVTTRSTPHTASFLLLGAQHIAVILAGPGASGAWISVWRWRSCMATTIPQTSPPHYFPTRWFCPPCCGSVKASGQELELLKMVANTKEKLHHGRHHIQMVCIVVVGGYDDETIDNHSRLSSSPTMPFRAVKKCSYKRQEALGSAEALGGLGPHLGLWWGGRVPLLG